MDEVGALETDVGIGKEVGADLHIPVLSKDNNQMDDLDYEAEDDDDINTNISASQQLPEKTEREADKVEECNESTNAKTAKESMEELEEGEVSDEDEESRNARLRPQPVCRFYSKGACTWGASCRFVHPGVLDKGNYNMFAPPRPILPGDDKDTVNIASLSAPSGATVHTSPVPPSGTLRESAWERGLRQAKEMKRRAQMRKETDGAEYEEKRTAMTLTQAELIDTENDYYARAASPIRDDREEEDAFSDFDDPYEPNKRHRSGSRHRVAPPPPANFMSPRGRYENHLQGAGLSRRFPQPTAADSRVQERIIADRYSPPPVGGTLGGTGRVRRVAPPPPEQGEGRSDQWADPWMRGGQGGTARRRHASGRSYSSGSSRSSSRSSGYSDRGRRRHARGRRRRSSSSSSRSSKSRSSSGSSRSRSQSRGRPRSRSHSWSRSRSSTPSNIPRRTIKRSPSQRSPPSSTAPLASQGLVGALTTRASFGATAPLQKRLGGLTTSTSALQVRKIKKEPEDKPASLKNASGQSVRTKDPRRRTSSGSSRSSRSPPPPRKKEHAAAAASKPIRSVVPPTLPLDAPPLCSAASQAKQQIKLTLKTTSTARPPTANASVLEKLGMSSEEIAESAARKRKASDAAQSEAPEMQPTADKTRKVEKDRKDRKKDKKTAADRREELLKQLKAVENAIAKKRTKMEGHR